MIASEQFKGRKWVREQPYNKEISTKTNQRMQRTLAEVIR
jgi:hypothetical protein